MTKPQLVKHYNSVEVQALMDTAIENAIIETQADIRRHKDPETRNQLLYRLDAIDCVSRQLRILIQDAT